MVRAKTERWQFPRDASSLSVQLAVNRDHQIFKGDVLAAPLEGPARNLDKAVAAGDLHVNDRQTPQVCLRQYLRDLVDVGIDVIEFGTADGDRLSLHEVGVEIGVGEGGAVGHQHQICTAQIRGV